MTTAIKEYQTDRGVVRLSPEIIKRYLVSGDASKVTDQEVMMFIGLNQYQKLNPFLRESYLIKYGNAPATMVVGKDVFVKRAANSKHYNGSESGIIVRNADGKIEQRSGAFKLKEEELLGGWAKAYRKNWEIPVEVSVTLGEYERHKNDGGLQKNWKEMPATMIRKVALSQALREAFPEDLEGLYSEEEMPVDSTMLSSKPVVIDEGAEEEEVKETISFEQAEALVKECANGDTDIVTKVIKDLGYNSLSDVLVEEYEQVKEEVRGELKDPAEDDPELSQMEL